MLSRIAPIVARTARSTSLVAPASRALSTGSITTAAEAAKLSGYSNIDFRIDEDKMVIDAVQQFAANNIGCLVTVNTSGMYQNALSWKGLSCESSGLILQLFSTTLGVARPFGRNFICDTTMEPLLVI